MFKLKRDLSSVKTSHVETNSHIFQRMQDQFRHKAEKK